MSDEVIVTIVDMLNSTLSQTMKPNDADKIIKSAADLLMSYVNTSGKD